MLRLSVRRGLQFLGRHENRLLPPLLLLSLPTLKTANPHPVLDQKSGFQHNAVHDFNHAFSLHTPTPLVTEQKLKEQVHITPQLIKKEEVVEGHHDDDGKVDYSDIRLRRLTLSDIDDLMRWAADEKASEFWGTFASKKDAMDYVTDAAIPHKAICLKNSNVAIGCISVTEYRHTNSCEFGYILAPKYWGKGIMTKAVKMVASYILVQLPHLRKIEAVVDFGNIASQRVLEKIGFTKKLLHREPAFKTLSLLYRLKISKSTSTTTSTSCRTELGIFPP